MDLTEETIKFWLKLEASLGKEIPSYIKNVFHACGYSNTINIKNINGGDMKYVEDFVRVELLQRLSEKCNRLKISMDENVKLQFFGSFCMDPSQFEFNKQERDLIFSMPDAVKRINSLDEDTKAVILQKSNQIGVWFSDVIPAESESETRTLKAPAGAENLLCKMLNAAKINSSRPKQGYRYGDDLKRLAVYNRVLAGPSAYKSLEMNLKGCFPSISTTNRYIHRSGHAVFEGVLRSQELLNYLKERNLPLWVSLSEDGTRVENRVQYDSRSVQVIGFVLPTDDNTGMPIPFCYKGRTAGEILSYFSRKIPVSHFVNTVMAQPLGDAPAFCLLVFGSDNKYTASDVSKRWTFISEELGKIGIGVLTVASDSDPKYNAAMRKNSGLGEDSKEFSMNGLFMCGQNFEPPFYVQDYPHLGTKLRNQFLKTIENGHIFPMGDYYIQHEHLNQLLKTCKKDQHLLTATALNPNDRQNFDSVMKMCDDRVLKLLKKEVHGSDATIIFLQLISDVVNAFMDEKLTPSARLEKMWHSVFLTRIWRRFISGRTDLTLKDNCMTNYTYYCIELNAHSLVMILSFLKREKLTHIFSAHFLSSQPCEAFYRAIRSISTVNSTVINCSVKEMLHRISRIQLLNDISNDKESGFSFPKPLKSHHSTCIRYSETEFPTIREIYDVIQKCKKSAIEIAETVGMIKKGEHLNDQFFSCQVSPYIFKSRKWKDIDCDSDGEFEDVCELETQLMSSSLKNYSQKVKEGSVTYDSSYVEMFCDERRFVFKKTSLCWLFAKESYKCSSDRIYRVRNPNKPKKQQCIKMLKSKIKPVQKNRNKGKK